MGKTLLKLGYTLARICHQLLCITHSRLCFFSEDCPSGLFHDHRGAA
jgi:hypothetical protein